MRVQLTREPSQLTTCTQTRDPFFYVPLGPVNMLMSEFVCQNNVWASGTTWKFRSVCIRTVYNDAQCNDAMTHVFVNALFRFKTATAVTAAIHALVSVDQVPTVDQIRNREVRDRNEEISSFRLFSY